MLVLDIFADIVCPWCYVGERRLQRALEAFEADHPDLDVTMNWHPFQLHPQMPTEGLPWRKFAEVKFGSWPHAEAAFRHVQTASREDDLQFAFERIANAPNTTDAHRVMLFAEEHGATWEASMRLYAAYFAEGRDLTDRDTLVELGGESGLPADELRAYLASEKGHQDVRESQVAAGQLGIQGVPFFVIDRRVALNGAQPVEVFTRALTKARQAAEASPEEHVQ